MNAHLKTLVIWLVVIAILVIGYQIFNTAGTPSRELDESEFYALVEAAIGIATIIDQLMSLIQQQQVA